MITKNYQKLLSAYSVSYGLDFMRAPYVVKNVLNENVHIGEASSSTGFSTTMIRIPQNIVATNPETTEMTGIKIGSGSTQPTDSDYKLENGINSGFTATRTSRTTTVEQDGSVTVSTSYTVTNTSGSNMTIAEIGAIVSVGNAGWPNDPISNIGSIYVNGHRNVLIDRSLVDPAITIPSGEAAVITYEFNVS